VHFASLTAIRTVIQAVLAQAYARLRLAIGAIFLAAASFFRLVALHAHNNRSRH